MHLLLRGRQLERKVTKKWVQVKACFQAAIIEEAGTMADREVNVNRGSLELDPRKYADSLQGQSGILCPC
jgi:hypothetical protein